ncbi:indolepyruvate ferredoxin oxidoreductase subunit alpha [Caldisalinibacter kiritimatiensis]|uniref:2-oxoglutarate oxidoreductase, delta subunit, putative n=1 Tax=Caldisalinibacter kiritimatiensis TaxID=1304284 RepID=R1CWU3_9FIRM|nr:4Fe-4S binding protein [Caldisalinibacter kiritimatiensis]EOD01094.1 2-oxoglutarate oxidoreductase, delta subunit, putative [Caldisalinibacter kiritimatiensis]
MATISKFKLEINNDWCKGCGICVAFCPKNVLSINDGKVFIQNVNNCIGCGQCELRCPDYAIFLGGKNNE